MALPRNVEQIFVANPATALGASDLLYLSQGGTTDSAIQGSSLLMQLKGYAADTGAANALVITLPVAPALTNGDIVYVKPNHNNTGASTLTINGGTTKNIDTISGALAGGELQTPFVYQFMFSTTVNAWIITNPTTVLKTATVAGQIALSAVKNIPTWSAMTYPSSAPVNSVLFVSTGPAVTGITPAANGILISSAANVPSWLAGGTTGQVLTATTGSPPSWQAAGGGGGVTAAQVQNQAFTAGADTGTADNYAVSYTPAITTLLDGMILSFLPANSNLTTAPVIAVDGNSPVTIFGMNESPLLPNDIGVGINALIIYSAANPSFELLNPQNSNVNTEFYINNDYLYAVDSGSANSYIISLPFPPDFSGSGGIIYFVPQNANSGASTITVNGVTYNILSATGSALVGGELQPNIIYSLFYNNILAPVTEGFFLQNSSLSGSSSPAGSDTQIQFNNSGSFGASTNLTFVTAQNNMAACAAYSANGSSVNSFGGGAGTVYLGGDQGFAWGNNSGIGNGTTGAVNFCWNGNIAAGNYSFSFGQQVSNFGGSGAVTMGSFASNNGADYAYAFGKNAKTNHQGAHVYSDSTITSAQDSLADTWNGFFTNGYYASGGSFHIMTVGSGLAVAEGSNAKQGIATLTAGVATVTNTSVTANSRVFLTAQDNNSIGALRVTGLTAGTGFVITSSSGSDSGVVAYQIFEPA